MRRSRQFTILLQVGLLVLASLFSEGRAQLVVGQLTAVVGRIPGSYPHTLAATAPARAEYPIRETRVTGLGVNKNMQAELITPVGDSPFPALLVLHTSSNLGVPDIEYARQLARQGYVSLVPYYFDVYGITFATRQDATTVHAERLYADFVSLLQYLRDNFNARKSGAVGFSMGGYWALVLAATKQISAGVSYYGALSGGGPGLSLRYRFEDVFAPDSSPVLILHGSNDTTVPVSLANNLARTLAGKGSPYELVIYPGVEHSFDRGTNLNPVARDDAWNRTQVFLGKYVTATTTTSTTTTATTTTSTTTSTRVTTATGTTTVTATTTTGTTTTATGTTTTATATTTTIPTAGLILTGTDGNDLLVGGDGNDTVKGLAGHDTLEGKSGQDSMDGGSGQDNLQGGAGNDSMEGGPGNDWMDGGTGGDNMDGGDDDDTLLGGAGSEDTLRGGPGNDYMDGMTTNDTLDGGAGNDTLVGGLGRDNLSGGDGDDTMVLRGGDIGRGETETIDGGNGADVVLLHGFLQRNVSGSSITDPVTEGTYTLSNLERVQHALLFAQIGNGGNFVSSVDLTNPSATTPATGRMDFSGDDGRPLPLALGGRPAASFADFTVPPLGSVTLGTDGLGSAVTGAAQVRADRPLGGVVRFAFPGLGIAGVGESQLVDAFMTPVIRSVAAGISTGIAVFNQGPATTLKLTLKNLIGVTARETEVAIPVNGHIARFVQELFADVGDFQGTLTVVGSPLAATAIQLGGQPGEFTTLPVTSIAPQPVAGPLYFAQFGNGGIVSSLFLVNPSATVRAKGELAFFNDDGNSLSIVVNGLVPASRVPFDIAPGGGAVFTTDGQGPVTVGSARATVSEGVIGGVLRFSLPGAGIAGVGSSVPVTGFITPVRRSVATGLNTGVAVASIGSAVRLTLTLRTAGGEAVANGTAIVELKPGGHAARFIHELFPNADTSDFQGVVTATAEGGTVAATAIQLGSQPGQFTTLPVTQLH